MWIVIMIQGIRDWYPEERLISEEHTDILKKVLDSVWDKKYITAHEIWNPDTGTMEDSLWSGEEVWAAVFWGCEKFFNFYFYNSWEPE